MLPIAVDVDGTIANTYVVLARRISELYAVHFSVDDITDYDFGEKARSIGITPEDCVRMMTYDIWQHEWQRIPLADEHVVPALRRLSEKYSVDIVTANANFTYVDKWLAANAVPHSHLVYNHRKHELERYKIFVEDNPLLTGRISEDCMIALYDRPWNRLAEGGNVTRFHSFGELPEIVDRIAGA